MSRLQKYTEYEYVCSEVERLPGILKDTLYIFNYLNCNPTYKRCTVGFHFCLNNKIGTVFQRGSELAYTDVFKPSSPMHATIINSISLLQFLYLTFNSDD